MRFVTQIPVPDDVSARFVEAKFEIDETRSLDPDLLPIHGLVDLYCEVCGVMQSKVAPSTFWYWRSKLGIEPDKDTGLYSEDDLKRLRYLAKRQKTGRFSMRQIAIQIQQGMYKYAC